MPNEERACDGAGELSRRAVALVAVGHQARHDDRLELGRYVARVRARRLHDAGAHDVEERFAAQARVERATGQDLPEDDAERVDVAAPVDALAARLLGRHVSELSLEDAGLLDEQLGARDPEIGDLHRAVVREEDVLRRHVAVDDLEGRPRLVLLLVRVVEALGRFADDVRADPGREPRPLGLGRRHEHAEVGALDVLHDEELTLVAAVGELVDLNDVGMVEASRELRLLHEHGSEAAG
ncbi:MAG: hypothetical protein U0235_01695 [Polyangiaceae bacterium]